MPPEIDVHITDPKEAAQLREFVATLGSARLVRERPLPLEIQSPVISGLWRDELSQLKGLISISRELVESNEFIPAGYLQLLDMYGSDYFFDKRPYNDKKKFAQDVLEVFGASLDYYSNFAERPGHLNRRGENHWFAYKSPPYGLMTPRDIRVVAYNTGIAGESKSHDQLVAMEGTLRAGGIIASAKIALMLGVTNLQRNRTI